MTSKPKQKLELTWIGKEKRPRLEPRILLEDKDLSYRSEAVEQLADDLFSDENDAPKAFDDNILIHGDNLLALKALEQQYAGKVKCVYIDPPYNTGQMFVNYEDGLEHSEWLTRFRDRLEILKALLMNDGVFFCQLNDDEAAYAKVLCDEVFGRGNFLNQISVKMKHTKSQQCCTLRILKKRVKSKIPIAQMSAGSARNLSFSIASGGQYLIVPQNLGLTTSSALSPKTSTAEPKSMSLILSPFGSMSTFSSLMSRWTMRLRAK